MCPAHHCSWVGACALRAGVGPSAPFHDQEGSHQHRCAGSKTASAPRNILLCERPHLHKIITHLYCHVKFLLFLLVLIFLCLLAPCTFYDFYAEKCYHHWRRGFRTGCCTPAAKLWHSGKDPHLAWSLVPSPLIVIK